MRELTVEANGRVLANDDTATAVIFLETHNNRGPASSSLTAANSPLATALGNIFIDLPKRLEFSGSAKRFPSDEPDVEVGVKLAIGRAFQAVADHYLDPVRHLIEEETVELMVLCRDVQAGPKAIEARRLAERYVLSPTPSKRAMAQTILDLLDEMERPYFLIVPDNGDAPIEMSEDEFRDACERIPALKEAAAKL